MNQAPQHCIEYLLHNPLIPKTYRLLATVCHGLEGLAEKEIAGLFPGTVFSEAFDGRLIFDVHAPLERIMKLLCADNIYLMLKKLSIGATKPDLQEFYSRITALDMSPVYDVLKLQKGSAAVTANASRTGKHSFSRFEIADIVQKALVENKKNGFTAGTADCHDVNIRIDVTDYTAYLSVKLTSVQFRYRDKTKSFMPGAIRPSVAHSLVYLSEPSREDVFLDPFCGSGTIAAEREAYPCRKILASDISEEAVTAAKSNVSGAVVVKQCSALDLNIKDGTISKIVTNLPWDVQIKSEDIRSLYTEFFAEAKRMLRQDGKIIALTDKHAEIESACAGIFQLKKSAELSLHGLHPAIYEIRGMGI